MAFYGREVGGEGVTYNPLLHEGRSRISDHIWGSRRMRLTKKDLKNSDKKWKKFTEMWQLETDIVLRDESDKSDLLVALPKKQP